MAYDIRLSNGDALISGGLADGTIDTTNSSLTLVGKNYPGYGTFLNQNLVRLIENFAKSSAPTAPLPGQLWWDSTNKYLKVNTATLKGTANQAWKTFATMTSGSTGPSNPVVGEQWWDTSSVQLKVYNGTGWTAIGPASTAVTGNTGAVPDTIVGLVPAGTYVVLKFFINDVLVGIWSKESSFTTADTNFPTINRGLNLRSDHTVYGNATVAAALLSGTTSVGALNFVRNDNSAAGAASRLLNGSLSVVDDTGIKFGADNDFEGLVQGTSVILRNVTNDGNLILSIKRSSTNTPFLLGNALSGMPELYNAPTSSMNSLTVATKGYVDTYFGGGTGTNTFAANLNPSANVTYNLGSTLFQWANVYAGNVIVSKNILPVSNISSNIGSSSLWFNTFFGVSVQAQYADLAERFESDRPYSPGTVVSLGGQAEITEVEEELSDEVFGVISTRAAYLMNGAAGSNETHPPVAVSGRVPVRVVGRVRKGDRLVSAGNGIARAASKSEMTPWNVIGRSLQNKNDLGEGTIEAIVTLNS
jgi:hypothetical protein